MTSGKKLNDIEKAEINILRANSNASNRKIAKILNRSESAIQKYLKDPIGYGEKYAHGRPSTLTKLQKRALIRSACNSTMSSRELCEEDCASLLEEPDKF